MNNFEGIEDALDVDGDIVPASKPAPPVPVEEFASTKEQLKKDYEYTRGNLYSLIEKGQEAVDGILDLAQQSDQPRAFEVAGQLIKHVGDVTDKIVDLQKKMKDLKAEDGPKNVTNNALFVGSTSELQKMIKKGLLNNTDK